MVLSESLMITITNYKLETKSSHIISTRLRIFIKLDSYQIGGLLDLVEPDTDISVVDDLLHVKVEGDAVL